MTEPIIIDKSAALNHFSAMIKCETTEDNALALSSFRELLQQLYPNIDKTCPRELAGNGVIYHWKGADSSKSIVLMSHYDVVPADAKAWSYQPFSGTNAEGRIWGRGAIDTKCTLCAIMECVERLIETGFVPKNDIYLCFGGDEETTGKSAKRIARRLYRRGIRPYLVVDEGGAVVNATEYGIQKPCVLVGIAEKGYLDVEFITSGKGGHTSLPPAFNPMEEMGEVLHRINKKNPFKFKICRPVATTVKYALKHAGFKHRTLIRAYRFWGRWLSKLIAKKFPEIKAMSGTIGSITQIEGGSAANVIPEKVRAVGNFRLVTGESVEYAMKTIKKTLKGLYVEINLLRGVDPSETSTIKGEGWDKLCKAITATWGDNALIPYLMLAGSDSRHYSIVSDSVYRFSPITLSHRDRVCIHGVNESIEIDNFLKIISFYVNLITGL